MRLRTLLSVVLTMFALPALAAELPDTPRRMPTPVPPPVAEPNEEGPSICFEVRILKLPAGFWNRAGARLNGELLSETQMRRLLEVVQSDRDACITQAPKITTDAGRSAQLSMRETRRFVTSLDAMRVKGATVLVPKNTPIALGDSLDICGVIYGKSVWIDGTFTRVRVEGEVELIPVASKITPVFEGGGQGQPITFTQYLQVPDVRTEKFRKTAVVPDGGTVVLCGWKQTEPAARGKKTTEFEVIVLATARIMRPEPAPMPRPIPPLVTKVFEVSDLVAPPATAKGKDANAAYHKNTERLVKVVTEMVRPYSWEGQGGRGSADYFDIGRALVVKNSPDAVSEVADLLEAIRRLKDPKAALADPPPVSPATYRYRLRNIAAEDAGNAVVRAFHGTNLQADVQIETSRNILRVTAGPEDLKRITALIERLDKTPTQVVLGAVVMEVPRGFTTDAGLTEGKPGENSWVLSEREMRMLTGHIRRAKERHELDIYSRPMVQVADGQTGHVQVGQTSPDVPVGLSLRVTPRVAPDGQSLVLRASAEVTSASRGTFEVTGPAGVGQVVEWPVFNTFSIQAAAALRPGQTLVLETTSLPPGGSFLTRVKHHYCPTQRTTLILISPRLVQTR